MNSGEPKRVIIMQETTFQTADERYEVTGLAGVRMHYIIFNANTIHFTELLFTTCQLEFKSSYKFKGLWDAAAKLLENTHYCPYVNSERVYQKNVVILFPDAKPG